VPAVIIGGVATLLVIAAYLGMFPELRLLDKFKRRSASASR
jgi:hypothetical protein